MSYTAHYRGCLIGHRALHLDTFDDSCKTDGFASFLMGKDANFLMGKDGRLPGSSFPRVCSGTVLSRVSDEKETTKANLFRIFHVNCKFPLTKKKKKRKKKPVKARCEIDQNPLSTNKIAGNFLKIYERQIKRALTNIKKKIEKFDSFFSFAIFFINLIEDTFLYLLDRKINRYIYS